MNHTTNAIASLDTSFARPRCVQQLDRRCYGPRRPPRGVADPATQARQGSACPISPRTRSPRRPPSNSVARTTAIPFAPCARDIANSCSRCAAREQDRREIHCLPPDLEERETERLAADDTSADQPFGFDIVATDITPVHAGWRCSRARTSSRSRTSARSSRTSTCPTRERRQTRRAGSARRQAPDSAVRSARSDRRGW